MADVHFVIRCEDLQCHLELPQQTSPTMLNGEDAVESRLHTGDKIHAGVSEFTMDIEGDLGRESESGVDQAASAEPAGVGGLVTLLELDEELLPQAEESENEAAFLGRLIEENQLQPAIRVQAHLLPSREVVWWGCLCVQQLLDGQLPAPQLAARDATVQWVADPTEENRRAAEAAAEEAEYSGPDGTLATAAFWTGDSIAPPESPEPVPPDERLPGVAVTGAILIASVAQEPERMEEKLRECLKLAADLADGKIEFPASDSAAS